MYGRNIRIYSVTEYLGITATAAGTAHGTNIKRIKSAALAIHKLRNRGVHNGVVNSQRLLEIWNTHVMPRATYGLHVVPKTPS